MSTVKIESGDYLTQVIHDDAGGFQIVTLLNGKPLATIGVKDSALSCHLFGETGKAIASLALFDGKPLLFDEDCKQVFPVPYTLAVDPSHLLN
ncbi:MAG: hypothetical protein KJZ87_06050 [Thermoguttaceae bacterium]|nr:hypothetical protein [Thermoguttaceae bacterium]